MYSLFQAKLRASIAWLLHKAYDDVIPDDLQEAFYGDAKFRCYLKPAVISKLVSGELYCLAAAHFFKDSLLQFESKFRGPQHHTGILYLYRLSVQSKKNKHGKNENKMSRYLKLSHLSLICRSIKSIMMFSTAQNNCESLHLAIVSRR